MDLERFLQEQEIWYDYALKEVRGGRKYGHWMWFIFPQLLGLGRSETSRKFAIRNREEAQAYLAHPVLGSRLREITEAVLALETNDVEGVFGYTDTMKLRSCMTLFWLVSGEELFAQVIEKYYRGKLDLQTLQMLGKK